MFARSAANDTLQGRAIHAINERWGEDFRKWGGRETIGIPVCKKKYSPFSFRIVNTEEEEDEENVGSTQQTKRRQPKFVVKVERMYGCKCHSDHRKAVIQRHGVRKGWEPFGQWSLKKAQELARKETERLNSPNPKLVSPSDSDGTIDSDGTTSEEEGWISSNEERRSTSSSLPTICNGGACLWKVKSAFDNVARELGVESEEEEEYEY